MEYRDILNVRSSSLSMAMGWWVGLGFGFIPIEGTKDPEVFNPISKGSSYTEPDLYALLHLQ